MLSWWHGDRSMSFGWTGQLGPGRGVVLLDLKSVLLELKDLGASADLVPLPRHTVLSALRDEYNGDVKVVLSDLGDNSYTIRGTCQSMASALAPTNILFAVAVRGENSFEELWAEVRDRWLDAPSCVRILSMSGGALTDLATRLEVPANTLLKGPELSWCTGSRSLKTQKKINGDTTPETATSETGVLVLLCGPPGAGKSTFCQMLSAISPSTATNYTVTDTHSWYRVSSDLLSLEVGSYGVREACLELCRSLIEQRVSHILIDRTNITLYQRKQWIDLALDKGLEVHAVVFDTQPSVCEHRIRGRDNHEGESEIFDKDLLVDVMWCCVESWEEVTENGFSRVTVVTEKEVEPLAKYYLSYLES
jgi:predicted kinase